MNAAKGTQSQISASEVFRFGIVTREMFALLDEFHQHPVPVVVPAVSRIDRSVLLGQALQLAGADIDSYDPLTSLSILAGITRDELRHSLQKACKMTNNPSFSSTSLTKGLLHLLDPHSFSSWNISHLQQAIHAVANDSEKHCYHQPPAVRPRTLLRSGELRNAFLKCCPSITFDIWIDQEARKQSGGRFDSDGNSLPPKPENSANKRKGEKKKSLLLQFPTIINGGHTRTTKIIIGRNFQNNDGFLIDSRERRRTESNDRRQRSRAIYNNKHHYNANNNNNNINISNNDNNGNGSGNDCELGSYTSEHYSDCNNSAADLEMQRHLRERQELQEESQRLSMELANIRRLYDMEMRTRQQQLQQQQFPTFKPI